MPEAGPEKGKIGKEKAEEKEKKEKEEKEKVPEKKKEHPKTVARNEVKAAVLLALQAVTSKDAKLQIRVVRMITGVHKNVTPAILADVVEKYYPAMSRSLPDDPAVVAAEREADLKEAEEAKKAADAAEAAAAKAAKEKAAKEKETKVLDDKGQEKKTKEQIKEQEKKEKEEAEKKAKEAEKKRLKAKEEAKKEEEAKTLPEVRALIHLLVCMAFVQRGNKQGAAECATALVSYIQNFNRRSLDVISARAYHYYSLAHENLGQLDKIRNTLLAYQRTACLQHNEPGQAQLIVLILRNFLHYKLYAQADNFRLNANFPESRANATYARYLFYQGRIFAIQLKYSDAYGSLIQAVRKAPQSIALGFRQAAYKLLVIVQLLMGDIPERNVFRQVGLQKALHPYFRLTQAVRVGNLEAFEKVHAEFKDAWARDDTTSLIARVRNNVIKTGLRKINVSYSRISLQDICTKLNLEGVEDAEFIVAKGIHDGVIDAVIDREKHYIYSKENIDAYSTHDPGAQFHKRVLSCMEIHNGAVKALRFPGGSHKVDFEEDEATRDDDEPVIEADQMEDD